MIYRPPAAYSAPLKWRFDLFSLSAAQDGADAGDEFAGVERLGQVIVGPEFQPDNPVDIFAARRQHKYRQRRRPPRSPDATQSLESVQPRQHHIQHDKRVGFVRHLRQTRFAVLNRLANKTLGTQKLRHEFTQLQIIVNDKHAIHNRPKRRDDGPLARLADFGSDSEGQWG
jgi:hypothetical protein